MPCASGNSVLTSVEGIQNLVQYFHLTSCLCGQNVSTPFELKGVKCNKRTDLSNKNSTNLTQLSGSTLRLIEQHDVDKLAKMRSCDIAQRKNDFSEKREKSLENAKAYKLKKGNPDFKNMVNI
jgi:hypothetical protein